MLLISALDILGTALFAMTGALAAGRKRMDVFGVVVLGCVTALGGGTLRDLLIDADTVFWIAETHYLAVAAASAAATFGLVRWRVLPQRLLVWGDALGLGAFTVIGFDRAFAHTDLYSIGIVMGVVTAVVGGLLRDVVADEIPFVLRREIYASASLAGACLYAALTYAGVGRAAPLVVLALTFGLRMWALRRHAGLPHLEVDDDA